MLFQLPLRHNNTRHGQNCQILRNNLLRPSCNSRAIQQNSSFMSTTLSNYAQVYKDTLSRVEQRGYQIVLGSKSESRKLIMNKVFEQVNFTYQSVSADIDEKAIRYSDPKVLVEKLAEAKADAIIKKHYSDSSKQNKILLITCDQVVTCNGEIREKPESVEEAKQFLSDYKTKPAQTVGSVRVADLHTGHVSSALDIAEVRFNGLRDDQIDALVDEGEVLWAAGALMIENPIVASCVEIVSGDEWQIRGLGFDTVLKCIKECLT